MATPVRYDISLTHGAQVPQLYVFMLTVLSGLLAVFVVLVLHYNCMVNLRRKVPYRIFSCCENSPCEVYFPYTIDSKQMERRILKKEQQALAKAAKNAGDTGQL